LAPPDCHQRMCRLLQGAPGAMLAVDLAAQTVTDPNGRQYLFEIHPARKKCLLEGLDDISRTEQYEGETAAFEEAYRGAGASLRRHLVGFPNRDFLDHRFQSGRLERLGKISISSGPP
jgi:hypothetical protein